MFSRFTFTFTGILLTCCTSAQNIQWERNYGGSENDYPRSIQTIGDKGFVVAGSSESSNNDVSGNYGEEDGWVIKTDASGVIEWEQHYGGSKRDIIESIQQTSDGGYVAVGSSLSNDYDMSGNYGGYDYWVLKLDSSGNIQWEQNYGGSSDDVPRYIQQTADEGFIVAGSTKSDDNIVSGNHGGEDGWVVKIDTSGNVEWEENYGGSKRDALSYIQQTADGGYITAGLSLSDDNDVSHNYGGRDYWILKINSSGAIQWEQNYGGSGHEAADFIQETSNGEYIIAGNSTSSDGNVSSNYGREDFWVIKIDGSGNLLWEQNYGGRDQDIALSIREASDNGYLVVGLSYSDDKDVPGNYGEADCLGVKIDSSGIIQWVQNYGGSDGDIALDVCATSGGDFAFIALSNSNDHNITTNHGKYDIWMFKIKDYGMEITDNSLSSNIKVYPRSTSRHLTIEMEAPQRKVEISITNTMGQMLYKERFFNLQILNLEIEAASGVYFIQVTTADKQSATVKFFKR